MLYRSLVLTISSHGIMKHGSMLAKNGNRAWKWTVEGWIEWT